MSCCQYDDSPVNMQCGEAAYGICFNCAKKSIDKLGCDAACKTKFSSYMDDVGRLKALLKTLFYEIERLHIEINNFSNKPNNNHGGKNGKT